MRKERFMDDTKLKKLGAELEKERLENGGQNPGQKSGSLGYPAAADRGSQDALSLGEGPCGKSLQ
jgi:hypothetical protein